jgi:hypothetical protein
MALSWLLRSGLAIAFIGAVWSLWPDQNGDPDYRARVERPAFTETWRAVAIDEGHANVHTATGRYSAFANLLHADGLRVLRSEGRITPEALRHVDVFVTANPLGVKGALQHVANLAGLERFIRLELDAFGSDEIATLERWVSDGGRALIISDHAPAGAAARRLAAAFGVEMTTWWAEDPVHHDRETRNPGVLVFSRANGLLADHPIVNGRDASERLDAVMTFTGQALKPPPHGEVILKLSPTAREYPYRVSNERSGRPVIGAQAVAVRHGRGRVVVVGEAAALTAQLVQIPGASPLKMGVNREGVDNAQFVLNVMHWLLGLLR